MARVQSESNGRRDDVGEPQRLEISALFGYDIRRNSPRLLYLLFLLRHVRRVDLLRRRQRALVLP